MAMPVSDNRSHLARVVPGMLFAAAIAASATLLRNAGPMSVFSPLIIAVSIGMVIGNLLLLPAPFQPGVVFAGRSVLRFAIILLGFQLSITQIVAIGLGGLLTVTLATIVTFSLTLLVGKWLGVDNRLGELIAAGTSICGASAVIAMNSVSRASEEDVVYAIGSVTLFGTILMFALPVLAKMLELNSQEFGVWAGSSIHEIAQVTGATLQFSDAAGETGVVVKLTRVLLLAPLVFFFGLFLRQSVDRNAGLIAIPSVPGFVVGFVGAVTINSVLQFDAATRAVLMAATTFLMSMSLGALGLQTNFDRLRSRGIRPLALGAIASILIVTMTLGTVFALRGLG